MTIPIRVESVVGEYFGGSAVRCLIEHEFPEPTRHAAPSIRWRSRWIGIFVAISLHVTFWFHKDLPRSRLAVCEVYAWGCGDCWLPQKVVVRSVRHWSLQPSSLTIGSTYASRTEIRQQRE